MQKIILFLCILLSMRIDGWFEKDRAAYAAEQNDFSKAESILQKMLVDAPQDPYLLYDAGVIAFQNNQSKQARAYFEKASDFVKYKDFPRSFKEQLFFNAGNACVAEHELHEAINWYDEVLTLDPTHERALHNKKIVQEMLKQQEQQQDQDLENDSDQNGDDQRDDKNQKKDSRDDKKDSKKGKSGSNNSEKKSQKQSQDDSKKQDKNQSNKDCGCNSQSSSDQESNQADQSKSEEKNDSSNSMTRSSSDVSSKEKSSEQQTGNDLENRDKFKEPKQEIDSSKTESKKDPQSNNGNPQRQERDDSKNGNDAQKRDQQNAQKGNYKQEQSSEKEGQTQKADFNQSKINTFEKQQGFMDSEKKDSSGVDQAILALLQAQEERDKMVQAHIISGSVKSQQDKGRSSHGW